MGSRKACCLAIASRDSAQPPETVVICHQTCYLCMPVCTTSIDAVSVWPSDGASLAWIQIMRDYVHCTMRVCLSVSTGGMSLQFKS